MLPIHERMYTWQGEGVHMGRAAFFIRTFGCPVKCPWCDSAGTWHKDYVPKDIERMKTEALVAEVKASKAKIVVITGGEPAVHDLADLASQLGAIDVKVHLETSGGFKIKGVMDWITLSPKRWGLPLPENVRGADEFKIIVEHPDDVGFYLKELADRGLYNNRYGELPPIWLHPEWSHHEDELVLSAISHHVKAQTYPNFRAGWQLHKMYKVDQLDARSRPLVPLGGDPARGY